MTLHIRLLKTQTSKECVCSLRAPAVFVLITRQDTFGSFWFLDSNFFLLSHPTVGVFLLPSEDGSDRTASRYVSIVVALSLQWLS